MLLLLRLTMVWLLAAGTRTQVKLPAAAGVEVLQPLACACARRQQRQQELTRTSEARQRSGFLLAPRAAVAAVVLCPLRLHLLEQEEPVLVAAALAVVVAAWGSLCRTC